MLCPRAQVSDSANRVQRLKQPLSSSGSNLHGAPLSQPASSTGPVRGQRIRWGQNEVREQVADGSEDESVFSDQDSDEDDMDDSPDVPNAKKRGVMH